MKMKKVKKIDNVIALAKRLASLRQGERCFTIGDIKNIINTGYREKKKDEYKDSR